MRMLKVMASLLTSAVLAGCASQAQTFSPSARGPSVTRAEMPSKVEGYAEVKSVLACIRNSGALKNTTIAIGVFTDSTDKGNASAPGSTGGYLPKGGSSIVLAQALKETGAKVVDLYENSTEANARQMLGAKPAKVNIDFMMNGIFTSLDFGSTLNADVRVAGLGPTATTGYAQLTLGTQLVQQGTKVIKQISIVERTVRFTSIGAGTGKVFGNTLVTGNASVTNQERLQFEALNGPIALAAADALVNEFPTAKQACGDQVAALLH
ncbi:MAG: hypothetical protein COY40_02300 [Alphaproteobacteria bacterium CG_4_10_14_0_8_um_filter_53_9]|nr:MAG: hypothetical protein COY40_02300 [Alphaproteobacteria bacterium CG_4_10_14_0_8_um_filter_53_9]